MADAVATSLPALLTFSPESFDIQMGPPPRPVSAAVPDETVLFEDLDAASKVDPVVLLVASDDYRTGVRRVGTPGPWCVN